MKRLYRDENGAVLTGVLAGIARYFSLRADVVRAVYCLVFAVSSPVAGAILYFLMSVIVPEKSKSGYTGYKVS